MRLGRIVLPVVAGAALYYGFFGGDHSAFDLRRMERELGAEQELLDAARAENERLRARADSLQHDPATLERLARERYGMIKEGERLYRFVDSAGSAGDAAGGER